MKTGDPVSLTSPDFMTSALVTVDMQNDFLLPGGSLEIPGAMDIIPRVTNLVESFRKNRLPIIHLVRLYLPDGSNVDICRRGAVENGRKMLVPESEGAEMVEDLKKSGDFALDADLLLSGGIQYVAEEECVIFKPRWGGFYQTALEDYLLRMGISTLVICGCHYPNCVRATVYEGSERDYRLVLASDAVSGFYERAERELGTIGVHLMTTEAIQDTLGIKA